MAAAAPLVAGRDCGPCTVCCVVVAIDKPDIQKKPGVPCRHCAGGCAIYETRPQVCRDYYCGWRRLGMFGEEWRPDKSGVFVEIEPPPLSFASAAVSLTLVGNPLKTVRQAWFIDFVIKSLKDELPLFLKLPGPPGYQGAKVLLNTRPMREARARMRVKELLEKALKGLSVYRFQEQPIVNRGNDVSL